MVNDRDLRSRADFASALSNVNNVKISDLLEFLVILLFFPFVLTRKSFTESRKIMKASMKKIFFDNLKKSLGEVPFHFHV